MIKDNNNNIQDLNYKAIKNLSGSEEEKINFMLENMESNKAYTYFIKDKTLDKKEILNSFKKKYLNYRENWHNQPQSCFEKKVYGNELKLRNIKPLCIDLELASVCDLACPHCFRQTIATPDKIMKKELALNLIDQATNLNIPSMKFNWRGEPLLNPNIYEIIDYAKSKGVLETIINTNATKLDEKNSQKIINSGLDLMIYSFDGGTKISYEKMRPGRFENNSFEQILSNIRNFSKIKKNMKSKFPRTKIQMVLTKETRKEKDSFFKLFKDIVDDVSVKQYSERGGKIKDIDEEKKKFVKEKLNDQGYDDAEVLFDVDDSVFISQERLPCEQPYQRLQITYDGKVSMCCYDWGSNHVVGYVDQQAIKTGNSEAEKVYLKAKKKKKGFELMKLKKINKFNKPKQEVLNLEKIWHGLEINKVRKEHVNGNIEKISICKNCSFKDTYKWKKV